ncbi:hormonally up-regulated neu tumor-associated kinase homolog A-like [Sinocyclocheilus grahami]|uniref:hormonally up-regulated neu tumor-associated kinase homolog A-like n=1 Tax=Sinocyclocheilus grahami TaxID=75366 RepID=UPI0007AD5915|nr:PREDICTED: hormonally up-regulated neu tumor-associated kinase homolog A-like [Sinocyclocheilus grahami]
MPAVLKSSLDGSMTDSGELEQAATPCLGKVPRDLLQNFPHTKRVGSYLVGKMINKGSFAKVMLGMHISTGEKVAIKVIDKKKARQDSYILKNMKREPRIHQLIRHPNIVLLLETLETENCYYMAMELCGGGDLMDRICERKRLEEREVRRYTRQILSAVEHLHRHRIVHRDLKIENLLMDELNNIKIVDFGLSNTLKADSLSLELLNTQCGSPAYAAPELLAHRKYGPKVDVWSVGVSMFAMLTGTLPFTVEPFNIKQLHQKMVNGEISPIPSDISKAAVQFVLSLLEPEPAKRPTVKTAMEDKWLNEGYAKRPLHTVTHKNRLRPEDLNSAVLNYMTESLGYGLSDIIHTVISNKPSTTLACYHLLLKKLTRHQKVVRTMKREENSEWNLLNKGLSRGRSNASAKSQQQSPQSDTANERSSRQASKTQWSQSQDRDTQSGTKRTAETIKLKQPSLVDRADPPSCLPLDTANEIAILVETHDGLIPKVLTFGEKEMLCVSPPKCSCREGSGTKLCDSAPCDATVTIETSRDSQTMKTSIKPHDLRPAYSDKYQALEYEHQPDDKLEKLQTFYSEKGASPRTGQRFKDLLLAIEEKTYNARHLSAVETTTQTSPLPRLRHTGMLKEATPRKVTWVGLTRHTAPGTGSSPFLVNGSKPPLFPSQRQQALVIKNLRHANEKRNTGTGGGGGISIPSNTAKRNSVQLRTAIQRRVTDLNLPMLPSALQNKSDKKTEILRMDFG